MTDEPKEWIMLMWDKEHHRWVRVFASDRERFNLHARSAHRQSLSEALETLAACVRRARQIQSGAEFRIMNYWTYEVIDGAIL